MEVKWFLKSREIKNGEIKSKIIVCADSLKQKDKLGCERRSKSINEKVLRQVVVKSVNSKINNIINNDKLERITMNEYKNSTSDVLDREIELLNQKLAKTEKAINSLYDDYSTGLIEEEDYRRFYKSEVERRNTYKSEISKLLSEKQDKKTLTKEELLAIVNRLKNIEDWTSEKLSELIYNIEIDIENNIYINYRYDVIGKL